MVIGIGGGSVLDVAKLLSVLCIDAAPSLDALLAGEKPQRRTRSILIPTTAGTGSGSDAQCDPGDPGERDQSRHYFTGDAT